uniref:Uncharacterized protein n=1 Tax=Cynoglossus semilaevis TaxID=244447 RepID=A0A3P8X5V2_CYNSE
MLRVLGSYRAEVAWLAEFKSCLSVKLNSSFYFQQDSSINRARTTKAWEAELLCHYTMQRLYSFSIFTARVFAMGDPANHGSSESATLCSTTG